MKRITEVPCDQGSKGCETAVLVDLGPALKERYGTFIERGEPKSLQDGRLFETLAEAATDLEKRKQEDEEPAAPITMPNDLDLLPVTDYTPARKLNGKIQLNMYLDEASHNLIKRFAERFFGGNKSMAVRHIIRNGIRVKETCA